MRRRALCAETTNINSTPQSIFPMYLKSKEGKGDTRTVKTNEDTLKLLKFCQDTEVFDGFATYDVFIDGELWVDEFKIDSIYRNSINSGYYLGFENSPSPWWVGDFLLNGTICIYNDD